MTYINPLVPRSGADRLVEVLLAAAAVLALAGLGCASEPPPPPLPAWVAAGVDTTSTSIAPEAAEAASLPRPSGGAAGKNESADFVVAALQGTGLRFGTDGSARALWGYMRTAHARVPAGEVRRGDVLFFNVRGPADLARGPEGLDEGCADHVALVWSREPDGRIVFVDVREKKKRLGYVSPAQPSIRRGEDGRVLNTFLRPKRPQDSREARYLAGEMLCGIARVTP